MKLTAKSGVGSVLNPRAARVARVGDWETAARIASPESEDAAAREAVALVDVSAARKFLAQGSGLDAAFADALKPCSAGARELATAGDSWGFRTRRDEAYLTAPLSPDLPSAIARFRELLEGKGGLWTEVTHGFDVIAVVGPLAAPALSKLCSLDLDDDRFPNVTAALGGLAKITALVVRRDRAGRRAYELHVDRSLGAYLWETLLDATREFGGVEAGTEALPQASMSAYGHAPQPRKREAE